MIIKINGRKFDFSGATLLDLLNEHGFSSQSGIAIAVNETVVPRTEWKKYALEPEDSVLVITPARGG